MADKDDAQDYIFFFFKMNLIISKNVANCKGLVFILFLLQEGFSLFLRSMISFLLI